VRAPKAFREAGFSVAVVPEAEAAVRLHVLPDPDRAVAAGTPVKRNVHRVAARVDLPSAGAALLKVHRSRGLAEAVRGLLLGSRAESEWRAALYLRAAGLPTPEPLFLAVRRRGPVPEVAATAVRWLPRRETFVPALRPQPPRMARALVARATRWIRALHDRGVDHRDLHSGNVLVGPGPGDRCDLELVDLHRTRIGRPPSPRARARGLAQWLHSLREAVGPGGRLRALAAYAGGDRAEARRLLARVEPRVRRRERARLASRSKRCVREGTGFAPLDGAWRGWRARDVDPASLDAAVVAHDAALRSRGAQVAKEGRKSRVTRHGHVVVKEALSPGLLGRLRDLVAPSRHRRGYENAHALLVRGVPTARPLAFARRDGRSFTVYEDLSAFPRLDHRARAAIRSREWGPRRRRQVVEASADLAARLHRQGIWHGDWKGCNWLVEERGTAVAFRLVDTDRVRFLRRVSRSRRLRNVAQLAASMPVAVSRADRLRWWRRYARGTALDGPEAARAAARDVAALLSRKTVVVDEPIE
jgi:tRNA A-37 threonylcarbamoyl transferase component Bud32